MPALSVTRATQAIVAGVLLSGVLVAAPANAGSVAPDGTERRAGNPTGVAAGSRPNGSDYLKLGLSSTPDGRIKVTWKRPGKYVKRYVVKVSPVRRLDAELKSYKVGRKKQSLIVPRAAGAATTSGNYSFVQIIIYRKDGTKGSSATKWIQAPLANACTAAPKNRVTVGSFNVRTWNVSTDKGFNWTVRRKNLISNIRSSGARVVALQEASGQPDSGYGSVPQHQSIVNLLNAADPAGNWVEAVDDALYSPAPGTLGGTRIVYDSNRFTKLNEGLVRINDSQAPKTSMLPWVRLQANGQAPFVFASTHLTVGNTKKEFLIRGRQIVKVIGTLKGLQAKYHNQVIVAGDLNSTGTTKPFNNAQRALLKAGFYDAYASKSISGAKLPTANQFKFPLERTPLRRDYIMSLGSAKGSCSYRNMIYTSKSQIASDHFMQVASLPLPPA